MQYEVGIDEGLTRHTDNAEVTLNVALAGGGRGGGTKADAAADKPPQSYDFKGGNLVFTGYKNENGVQRNTPVSFAHRTGWAVLHLGGEFHQAQPITEGVRCNLILWAKSLKFRKANGCPLCGETSMLVDSIYTDV